MRHEAKGKPLDIGFSCVKRFRMLGDAVCFLLLAARCLLPLQRLVCEIAEEVKPEMKFQSQAMAGFCLRGSPLQRVFHLRHEATGKQLDIMKSLTDSAGILFYLHLQ